MEKIKIGDIIEGQVTGIESYGIFINVNEFYSGLIHISEINNSYVKNINDYVKIGDMIFINVIGVNENTGHLNLSIKNINYKNEPNESKIKESVKGFLPLYEKLPEWTEETLSKIKNEQ